MSPDYIHISLLLEFLFFNDAFSNFFVQTCRIHHVFLLQFVFFTFIYIHANSFANLFCLLQLLINRIVSSMYTWNFYFFCSVCLTFRTFLVCVQKSLWGTVSTTITKYHGGIYFFGGIWFFVIATLKLKVFFYLKNQCWYFSLYSCHLNLHILFCVTSTCPREICLLKNFAEYPMFSSQLLQCTSQHFCGDCLRLLVTYLSLFPCVHL